MMTRGMYHCWNYISTPGYLLRVSQNPLQVARKVYLDEKTNIISLEML